MTAIAAARQIWLFTFVLLLLPLHDQSASVTTASADQKLLDEAVARATEVKAFGETIGIEPSDALRVSTRARRGVSRLWVWLQKKGTLATRAPMDFVLQLGFSSEQAKVPLTSVRHWHEMAGYSYYWRHSSEFESDESASAITIDFATESVRRQVEVVLHEDLHANAPFKGWPFRVNEGIVTPLADLATLAFFRARGDHANIEATEAHIQEQRKLSRELNELVEKMQELFAKGPLEPARTSALRKVQEASVYSRFFQHHVGDQSLEILLEAKVSHDWAYYGLYDAVLNLYEQNGRNIGKLIEVFKNAPSGGPELEAFLGELDR
jgi:hypothetical protein